MNKQTKPRSVIDRWTGRDPAAIKQARQGKPIGDLTQVVRMGATWSNVPNTLLEDSAGGLWLGFTEDRSAGQADKAGCQAERVEAVSLEMALDWLRNVSEYTDGWDGDIADICRITLAELKRRSRPGAQ